MSVRLLVTTISPAKTAELIKMPFGILTQVDFRNQADLLNKIQLHYWKEILKGE